MQSVRLLIPIEYAVMYSKNTFSASFIFVKLSKEPPLVWRMLFVW